MKIVQTIEVNTKGCEKWETKRLEDITYSIYSGDELTDSQMLEPGTHPCVRNRDINKLDIVFSECISKVNPETLKRPHRNIAKGFIVMSDMGTEKGLGRACVYSGEEFPIIGSSVVAIATEVNPIFLAFMINSPFVRKQIHRKMKGTLVQHLRAADLRNLLIPLPDGETQDRCAEIIIKTRGTLKAVDELSKD